MGNCISRRSHSDPSDSTDLHAWTAPTEPDTRNVARAEKSANNDLSLPIPSVDTKLNLPFLEDEADPCAVRNLTDATTPNATKPQSTTELYKPTRSYQATHSGKTARASKEAPPAKDSSLFAAHSAPSGDRTNHIGPHSSGGQIADNNDFNMIALPINTESNPTSPEGAADLATLREKCPRFRILVIGKANAGKTTILQKMCNTSEAPVIKDQGGNILDPSIISPTDGRGIHNINNELTFSTNPGFVFHDSPGFEAGSTKELEDVQGFIAQRAATDSLQQQLHAIWYCLPTDNDRPLSDAEMSFFERGTGRVPVIAIFTKYDGMILKEYNRLRYEENSTKAKARALAPLRAEDLFMNSEHYLRRVQGASYCPARYLRVQAMHKPESNCIELSKQTVDALDSKQLRLLFVSVQQVNVHLSTEYALRSYILEAMAQPDSVKREALTTTMMNAIFYYGHLAWDQNYSQLRVSPEDMQEMKPFGELKKDGGAGKYGFTVGFEEVFTALKSAVSSLAGQKVSSSQRLDIGISLLIAAEDSLWFKEKGLSNHAAFHLAWENYQQSSRRTDMVNKVKEYEGINYQELTGNQKEEWVQRMLAIVKNFTVQP